MRHWQPSSSWHNCWRRWAMRDPRTGSENWIREDPGSRSSRDPDPAGIQIQPGSRSLVRIRHPSPVRVLVLAVLVRAAGSHSCAPDPARPQEPAVVEEVRQAVAALTPPGQDPARDPLQDLAQPLPQTLRDLGVRSSCSTAHLVRWAHPSVLQPAIDSVFDHLSSRLQLHVDKARPAPRPSKPCLVIYADPNALIPNSSTQRPDPNALIPTP